MLSQRYANHQQSGWELSADVSFLTWVVWTLLAAFLAETSHFRETAMLQAGNPG
jgi:hypothetical protein